MVYDCSGRYVQPVAATMSSNHGSGCFQADSCIDMENTNSTNITHCSNAPLSMCHSDPADTNSWLQVGASLLLFCFLACEARMPILVSS